MTKLVQPLKFIGTAVGDYTLPMPSDYKFELQKVYVEDPSRSNSGAISVFPDKFFVPYFTVTWNVIDFDKYAEIMKIIQVDELVTEYYDTNDKMYKRAKFYVQQPTYNKLYTMQREFQFVTNLQLVFAGTMNDIDRFNIEYNANEGLGTVSSQSGLSGDEIVLSSGSGITKAGYVLESWNTRADGLGQRYELGSVYAITRNVVLYAQWVVPEYFYITLSYGYASGNSSLPTEKVNVNRTTLTVSGLPTNVPVCKAGTNDEIFDAEGNKVYSFNGWYKLSETADPTDSSAKIDNGTRYPYNHDTVLYAHFDIRKYTLTFDARGGSEIEPITAEFKTAISVPKPSKDKHSFDGWYYTVTDDKGNSEEKKFTSTTMPYTNLNLYAKWSGV